MKKTFPSHSDDCACCFCDIDHLRDALERIAAMDEPQNAGVYIAAQIATEALNR